jgi:membrane glycosyltransferase
MRRVLISAFVCAAARPYTGTGDEVMEELKVTWEKALTVWWSVAWRTVLFGFLAGLALGFVIGFFGGILHLDPRFLSRLSILAGIVTSVVVGIWAVKHILARRFKDFRIVLLPLD